jgi:hypothetical protein
MTTSDFANILLASLGKLPQIQRVDLHTEGSIVSGRAFIDNAIFLSFYFNQTTTTQAFALVKGTNRIWGIDFDDIRGWHLHPIGSPQDHMPIQAQNIPGIIAQLEIVLNSLTENR